MRWPPGASRDGRSRRRSACRRRRYGGSSEEAGLHVKASLGRAHAEDARRLRPALTVHPEGARDGFDAVLLPFKSKLAGGTDYALHLLAGLHQLVEVLPARRDAGDHYRRRRWRLAWTSPRRRPSLRCKRGGRMPGKRAPPGTAASAAASDFLPASGYGGTTLLSALGSLNPRNLRAGFGA